MNITFQSVNFTADVKLLNFIQRKMDKLENYYDKVVGGEVYLKVENTSTKENKIVEIKLHVPGNELVVKKHGRAFEQAADFCAEAMRRQLKKHKEKNRVLVS